MAILPIYYLTDSTFYLKDFSLRIPSRRILKEEFSSDWLKNIIFDMFETLYSTTSGVGLAAPQVGIQLQLIVIDIKRSGKKPLVLINPEYIPLTDNLIESNESCISVPHLIGTVHRYEKIKLRYYDLSGKLIEKQCEGFESKVFQHEIDHINGIVYVDKLVCKENLTESLGQPNKTAKIALDNILHSEE